jgi:RecA-family ATPase
MKNHKIPPHSLEAEKAILGAILLENKSLNECLSVIGPENFYDSRHQIIFQAMGDIKDDGKAIDLVILSEHLRQAGTLSKSGGISYIATIFDNAMSAENILYYCQIVKDKSVRRELITAAEEIQNKATDGESLTTLLEIGRQSLDRIWAEDDKSLHFKNAASWIEQESPAADQVFKDTFDTGDKVAIIGSSKLMKSFFLQQSLLCLATGRPFLNWTITKQRRCCHIQYEVKSLHQHRRLRRMAKALRIKPSDIEDNLMILNARGLGITGVEGIRKIGRAIMPYEPEIISFDPLYKVADGVENAAESMKIVLNVFDELAEKTGAAILYVHHDAKGSPGDRDIRDRGAGSNVLGRDYDACFTLTSHASDPDAIVIETLLRNYRPQEPFAVQFMEDEHGGYFFEIRPDLLPDKKTSKTKPQQPALSTYLPIAEVILGRGEIEIAVFKERFKEQSGLSDHRVRDFMTWATSGGVPHLATREQRGYRVNKKWISLSGGNSEN